ncbi:hypothetical protein [Nocardioides jishulii]|uniref:Uncharacterized protein n=1 Tax=Nocardioides jishulii TaxID=2575440 RepID=A0A4U2YSZ6_9ACTN|nr:hypothetical protein [Nocardioides jishulii]QCX28500.1 hypothetical protein FCL41_13910 [Nocardioides jishulii]TKI64607.1 hypothetical protein FC770_05665 [Nocardioides jishulii]
MFRAPVVGVLTASVVMVVFQSAPGASGEQRPTVTCIDATVRTVDARIDHLRHVVEAMRRGADPRSLPKAPSDAPLAACGVR